MLQTMLQDLFVLNVPILEKIIRTILVYALLLILLRLAGRRELAQLNPFDLVVLLMLSNTVQNAIIGEDNTLIGGVIGAATLIGFNQLVVRFFYQNQVAKKSIEDDETLLIRNGEVDKKEMRRELITYHELVVAARQQGIDSLEEVETADLDNAGSIMFKRKQPTNDDRRHKELLDRLEKLTDELAALKGRS